MKTRVISPGDQVLGTANAMRHCLPLSLKEMLPFSHRLVIINVSFYFTPMFIDTPNSTHEPKDENS